MIFTRLRQPEMIFDRMASVWTTVEPTSQTIRVTQLGPGEEGK